MWWLGTNTLGVMRWQPRLRGGREIVFCAHFGLVVAMEEGSLAVVVVIARTRTGGERGFAAHNTELWTCISVRKPTGRLFQAQLYGAITILRYRVESRFLLNFSFPFTLCRTIFCFLFYYFLFFAFCVLEMNNCLPSLPSVARLIGCHVCFYKWINSNLEKIQKHLIFSENHDAAMCN